MSGYDVSPGGSPEDVKEAKQDLLNQDLNAGIPVLIGDQLAMAPAEPELAPEPEPLPAEPLPEIPPELPPEEEPESAAPAEEPAAPVEPKKRKTADPVEVAPASVEEPAA